MSVNCAALINNYSSAKDYVMSAKWKIYYRHIGICVAEQPRQPHDHQHPTNTHNSHSHLHKMFIYSFSHLFRNMAFEQGLMSESSRNILWWWDNYYKIFILNRNSNFIYYNLIKKRIYYYNLILK